MQLFDLSTTYCQIPYQITETGWIMVLSSLIRAVPLDDVLGPSAITLFIDHCPLPSKVKVAGN